MGSSKSDKNDLKRKIFKLLDEDEEFKYAIAGKLGMKEISTKLSSHDQKFYELLAEIRAIRSKSEEHDKKFNEMLTEIRTNRSDIREIRTSIDRMMVSLEDEAHEVIEYLLKVNHEVNITLSVLYESNIEIDIYGVSDDICVIGEASVRVGTGMIRGLLKKYKYLKQNYPMKLRKKVILVLYGVKILPQLIIEAKRNNLWLVTATREITEMVFQERK